MTLAQRLLRGGHCLTVAVTMSLVSAQVMAAGGMRASPVVVESAEMRLLAPLTWVAGSVVSRNEAQLGAEVAGRLIKVADEGTAVAAGATLARIDDVLLKADLAEAEAALAREQANLTYLSNEVVRLEQLVQQNNAATTQLEQTTSQRDASRSAVAAAEAKLNAAREQLARATLKAPFAGVVTARLKRSGEWVAVGDAVLQLVAARDLEAEAAAPLALRRHLSPDQRLELQSQEGDGIGRIRTIVPVADPTSRLLTLRIDLLEGQWTAGQPLRVALPSAKPREVLSVSRDALILRRSGTILFKVGDDNTAQPVPVELGVASGSYIEVRGPLKAGDRVVIRGNERLRPGQPVEIKGGAAAQ